jgi:hypothetical protein
MHTHFLKMFKLYFLPNNQYMTPYIFTHIFCKFYKECPHQE